MSIAALSALSIAIIMRVTSVNARHANTVGDPTPIVMLETLGWAAQHFGAVFVLPAQLQRPGRIRGHAWFIVPRVTKVLETRITIQIAFFTVGIVYADGKTFCVVNGLNGKSIRGEKETAQE